MALPYHSSFSLDLVGCALYKLSRINNGIEGSKINTVTVSFRHIIGVGTFMDVKWVVGTFINISDEIGSLYLSV